MLHIDSTSQCFEVGDMEVVTMPDKITDLSLNVPKRRICEDIPSLLILIHEEKEIAIQRRHPSIVHKEHLVFLQEFSHHHIQRCMPLMGVSRNMEPTTSILHPFLSWDHIMGV
jgi:hypothetical protein